MKNIVRRLFFFLALGVLLFSLGKIGYTFYQYKEIENTYQTLTHEVVDATQPYTHLVSSENTPEIETYKEEYGVPPRIDWDTLLAQNSDIIGWIWMPQVSVNYPILYHEHKDYYLHRNYLKEWSIAGSIFLDYKNNPDLTDVNTIIYGHNMLNDTMFGKMRYFFDDENAPHNPYIWVLTPQVDYVYEIYTSFIDDPLGDSYLFYDKDADPRVFSDWITAMHERRVVEHPLPSITPKDHIVTLSSCASDVEVRRISQAKRIYENRKSDAFEID